MSSRFKADPTMMTKLEAKLEAKNKNTTKLSMRRSNRKTIRTPKEASTQSDFSCGPWSVGWANDMIAGQVASKNGYVQHLADDDDDDDDHYSNDHHHGAYSVEREHTEPSDPPDDDDDSSTSSSPVPSHHTPSRGSSSNSQNHPSTTTIKTKGKNKMNEPPLYFGAAMESAMMNENNNTARAMDQHAPGDSSESSPNQHLPIHKRQKEQQKQNTKTSSNRRYSDPSSEPADCILDESSGSIVPEQQQPPPDDEEEQENDNHDDDHNNNLESPSPPQPDNSSSSDRWSFGGGDWDMSNINNNKKEEPELVALHTEDGGTPLQSAVSSSFVSAATAVQGNLSNDTAPEQVMLDSVVLLSTANRSSSPVPHEATALTASTTVNQNNNNNNQNNNNNNNNITNNFAATSTQAKPFNDSASLQLSVDPVFQVGKRMSESTSSQMTGSDASLAKIRYQTTTTTASQSLNKQHSFILDDYDDEDESFTTGSKALQKHQPHAPHRGQEPPEAAVPGSPQGPPASPNQKRRSTIGGSSRSLRNANSPVPPAAEQYRFDASSGQSSDLHIGVAAAANANGNAVVKSPPRRNSRQRTMPAADFDATPKIEGSRKRPALPAVPLPDRTDRTEDDDIISEPFHDGSMSSLSNYSSSGKEFVSEEPSYSQQPSTYTKSTDEDDPEHDEEEDTRDKAGDRKQTEVTRHRRSFENEGNHEEGDEEDGLFRRDDNRRGGDGLFRDDKFGQDVERYRTPDDFEVMNPDLARETDSESDDVENHDDEDGARLIHGPAKTYQSMGSSTDGQTHTSTRTQLWRFFFKYYNWHCIVAGIGCGILLLLILFTVLYFLLWRDKDDDDGEMPSPVGVVPAVVTLAPTVRPTAAPTAAPPVAAPYPDGDLMPTSFMDGWDKPGAPPLAATRMPTFGPTVDSMPPTWSEPYAVIVKGPPTPGPTLAPTGFALDEIVQPPTFPYAVIPPPSQTAASPTLSPTPWELYNPNHQVWTNPQDDIPHDQVPYDDCTGIVDETVLQRLNCHGTDMEYRPGGFDPNRFGDTGGGQ